MSSLSNFAEASLLDHLFNLAAYTQPTIYIAVSTADPTDNASGLTEPSGNNYSRITTSSSDWTRSVSTVENAVELAFPEATGSWGTITHVALMDALTAGNMIAHTNLTGGGVAIQANDTLRFPAGELTLTMD